MRVGKTSFLKLLGRRLEQRRLERVRSQRRRSHGGAEMVRRARGAHPAHHRGAGGLQEGRLVHPRHSADRLERHASGPGGEHPRSDPARHRGRPPHRVDRSLGGRHVAYPAAAPALCAALSRSPASIRWSRRKPTSSPATWRAPSPRQAASKWMPAPSTWRSPRHANTSPPLAFPAPRSIF